VGNKVKLVSNKINSLFKNKVFTNGTWLYALQFFNTIVPLLTLPYITRMLGSAQYGVFSYSLNIIIYFQVIVEYGFNLSGTRKVALTNDKVEQSKIYSRITFSKLSLCLISFSLMITLILISGMGKKHIISILILYLMVIGSAIQQIWLFQGLQIMKYITIINLVSRSLSVLLIFILVKEQEDIYIYCGLFAITSFLNGILSFLLTKFNLKIKLSKVSINNIIEELKEGWYTFTTSAMSTIFSGIGITILGMYKISDSSIGMYTAIQKIPLIMTMLYAPIGQAIFPYVSKRFSISFELGIKTIKRFLKIVIPITVIISLILIVSSSNIVTLLYGSEYSRSSSLLIPLVVWFLFSIINNLLGIQILIASGHLKEYSNAFKVGVLSIIILNLSLGAIWDESGIAYATMFSELLLTVAILNQIIKVKHKIDSYSL
jgi:polysaccharide transporter, PST family